MRELTARAGGRVETQNTTTSPKGFTVWFTRNHSLSTRRKKKTNKKPTNHHHHDGLAISGSMKSSISNGQSHEMSDVYPVVSAQAQAKFSWLFLQDLRIFLFRLSGHSGALAPHSAVMINGSSTGAFILVGIYIWMCIEPWGLSRVTERLDTPLWRLVGREWTE